MATKIMAEEESSCPAEKGSSPRQPAALDSSTISSIVLIGRIARKKKRKGGIELAIRSWKVDEEDPPANRPPIVVCIPKIVTDTIIRHPVFAQLDALVQVIYVQDPSLWCSHRVVSLELLECPGEPQAVQAVLNEPSLWYSLRPDMDDEEEEKLDFQAKNQHHLVRQLVARLQRRKLETPRERPPVVKFHTLEALKMLEQETQLVDITSSSINIDTNLLPPPTTGNWNLPEQGQVVIQSNHGKLTRQEYLERKKYPQVGWLLQRLQQLHTRLPFRHVLDVGGGRGDLAIQVAQTFEHAHVTVVDLNLTSLQAGEAFAHSKGVGDRMHWICRDFCDFIKDQSLNNGPIDLIIAWHACGDLSDLALQLGVDHRAAVVVCPCCYSKMAHQTVATQLAELQGRPDLSRRGMHVVNSQRHFHLGNRGYCVRLEEYSAEWSGRNQVLVAYPRDR